MQILKAAALTLVTLALRFEIAATQGQGTVRCFEQYVLADNTITGYIDVPNKAFQTVDFLITDDTQAQNKHYSKLNVQGPQSFSFATHQSANIKYCFTSTLQADQQPGPEMKRHVFLHVESEHLKGEKIKEQNSRFQAMEAEVRWLNQMLDEASRELKIYETEDEKMYKINENTKARVFNSSGLSFLILIGLGVWEVYYLYSFFKKKVFQFH